jgi:hypothetical protein
VVAVKPFEPNQALQKVSPKVLLALARATERLGLHTGNLGLVRLGRLRQAALKQPPPREK